MASSASALLLLELQADGENSGTWGGRANDTFSRLEEGIADLTSVAVTVSDVTLTDTQFVTNEARAAIIEATGTLTGNRSIIVPTRTKPYIVKNDTGGAFTLTVKTSAGTGPTVPQGGKAIVYCDGTDVILVVDTGTSVEIVNDTSPQLGGALDTNAFAINESEAGAVASSSTTNIWQTSGNTQHVTGTVTINSLSTAPRVGAVRRVIFDSTLQLTHGANLILPGAANITTASGDVAVFYADTTSQIRCVTYTKADGKAVVEAAATSEFPSATRMLFQQTSAPTGWTKDTAADKNNAAFRSVTGAVGTAGNDNFTTVFGGSKVTGSTTLSESQIPGHTHGPGSLGTDTDGDHVHTQTRTPNVTGHVGNNQNVPRDTTGDTPALDAAGAMTAAGDHNHSVTTGVTASTGGSSGHTHTRPNMDVKYVDVIVASKD